MLWGCGGGLLIDEKNFFTRPRAWAELFYIKGRRSALKFAVILSEFLQNMPRAERPNFNFHAQTIFLTYAQCTLTKEELLHHLNLLFEIKDYAIALELHSDGHPHLHAFLKLERKIHKTTPDFADIEGFHPNITAPRSIKAVITYVQKVSKKTH